MWYLAFLCLCIDVSLSALPSNVTWKLLAWAGGNDQVDGLVVDIDLFNQANLIPALKSKGKIVICYISAGSWEPDRPDSSDPGWGPLKIGKMDGWNENWLDIRKLDGLQVMQGKRIDRAKSVGCDAIEPDNTDCFDNQDCWSTMKNPSVTAGSQVKLAQIAYNTWLANYTHSKGMLIALKNTLGLANALVAYFDLAINEQCHLYNECNSYQPFISVGKPILNIEYTTAAQESGLCVKATAQHTITKYCRGNNQCNNGASLLSCFK